MTVFAEYLLKVMICSGVLTGYYWLALRNKIFHSWNRFYLLAAIVTSLLLPFVKISFVTDTQPANVPAYAILQTVTTNDVWFPDQTATASATPITTEQISLLLYVLVSFGLFVTLVVMLLRIKKLISAYEHWKMKDLTFVDTDAKGTPFSFMHYIFWNREIDFESAQGQQIFKHELIHVKEKHSIDKLFLQLVLIVFWINPFFWIIRKELTMIHEFIADRKSVKDSDASALAAMILTAAFPGHTISLTNPFFYSPIKRRLLMLSKLQNPKVGYISRLLLLPLLTILFSAFALKIKENDNASSIPRLEKPLTVVIDAGHGLIDGKRHGAISLNGITEDEITLAISKKIKHLNNDPNLKLIFTRSDKNFIEQKDRVRIAEANNADLFISIHANYVTQLSKDGKLLENPMNGFELYVTRDGNQYLQESKELGSAIISEMKNFMPIREPGIKQRNSGIWVIDAAPCPAVLLECGFVSNSKDVAFLTDEKNQEKIAHAILLAIKNYSGNTKKSIVKESQLKTDSTPKTNTKKPIEKLKKEKSVIDNNMSAGSSPMAVANENIKVLYIGLDNSLVISSGNVPSDEIIVTSNNGTIHNIDGKWIARPTSTGEAIITISTRTNNKKVVLLTSTFNVKNIPDPVISIAGVKGGRLSVEKFKNAKQLDIDEDWEITNYVIYFTGTGFEKAVYKQVSGSNVFTDELLTLINKTEAGSTISIDEVRAKMKKTPVQTKVPGIFFNLQK